MKVDEFGALYLVARNLILHRPGTYQELAEEYNTHIEWLKKVGSGKIGDPGVNRVEAFLKKAGYQIKICRNGDFIK